MASRRQTTTATKKPKAKKPAAKQPVAKKAAPGSAKKAPAAKAKSGQRSSASSVAEPARTARTRKAGVAATKGSEVTGAGSGEQAEKSGGVRLSDARLLSTTEDDRFRADIDDGPEPAYLSRSFPPTAPGVAEDPVRRAPDHSGKYVYCIVQTEEELRFGAIGIGADPSEVHTVRFQDIAAVVSDAPIEVYDPTRENVLAHERVNEIVMRQHTVIPMSFGTVFNTHDDIVELLRSAYDAFREVLTKMQNKLEFGLKVLWDPEQLITALEAEDENLRRLKQEISSQRGSTYFARMQYGRLVDQLLQERSEAFVSRIFTALRDVSVASRANKPIGDRMILNAAFLVSRDQEEAFDKAVRAVGSELDNLTFRYTGPWPPYNFVNIRLKLERAKDTE